MNAAGRSFLWATHYCGAQATYPEVVARRAGTLPACAGIPPYLVLLRVGFALPAALLRRRCALTAPFHPYLSLAARAVCFLWHFPSNRLQPAVPDVIRHTALRSSDFPLSCVLQQRPSGPAANICNYSAKRGRRRTAPTHRLRPGRNAIFVAPELHACTSLLNFGREGEAVKQKGRADQQRNRTDEVNRAILVRDPTQKRHETDANGGGN